LFFETPEQGKNARNNVSLKNTMNEQPNAGYDKYNPKKHASFSGEFRIERRLSSVVNSINNLSS